MGKQTVFTTIRHGLLNNRVNVYGIVSGFEKSNESLLIQLRDETGKLEIVVDRKVTLLFKNLQKGDILRCFHLKKSKGRALFDSDDRKTQIVAYAGGSESFIPKFCTSNTGRNVDHKRITELRSIPITDSYSEKDRQYKEHREKIFLALSCGLTRPPIPDSLKEYQEQFSQIRVQDAPTLRSLSEITARHITNNLTNDRFFNFFCQVLSVHKTTTGYVVTGWDGSNSEELVDGLATTESLGICEDIIPYCQSEEVVKRTINIMFYGDSWKSQMMQLNENDIILVANAHINTRQLGEKVLAMHEGQEHRRALLVVPKGHLAAERVLQCCNSRLTSSKRIPLTQRVAPSQTVVNEELPEQEVMGDINALLSTQSSIPTWQPTQTQMVLSQKFRERDLNSLPQTVGESQRKVTVISEENTKVVEERDEDEAMEVDVDPSENEVEWIESVNVSAITSLNNRPVQLLLGDISFESELTTVLHLPKGQSYHFKRSIRINGPLWKTLVHLEMSHLSIDRESEQIVATSYDSIQSIHFLVPVENEQNDVILFAFGLETLHKVFTEIPRKPENENVGMTWWIQETSNYLMTNFQRDKTFVSASILLKFEDGCLLKVHRAERINMQKK